MSKVKSLTSKILIASLFAAVHVQAVEFVQRDQFISGRAETLRDEVWVSAETIQISGAAQSDLFAMGGTVSLEGLFQGDVWAGGTHVIAAGTFDDQVRLAARTVQVSGTMHGSLTAVGSTVHLEPTAVLDKNLLCIGDNVITEARVHGNVDMIAKKATIGGQIDGDLTVTAQEIVLLPGTLVKGNLRYTAPKELVPAPSVVLTGEMTRTFETPEPEPFLKPNLAGHFGFALSALLTGLVFCALFPRYTAGATALLRSSRAPCMLTGLAALLLIPLMILILLFTLIGLPLSLLLLLFYLILVYLSKIITGLALGALILRRKEITKRNRGTTLAAGLLIIYALTAFTAISLFVNTLVAVSGLGALLLALFKKPVLIIQTPADLKNITEG